MNLENEIKLMQIIEGHKNIMQNLADCLKIVGKRQADLEKEVEDLKVLVHANNIVRKS
jgi:hypothetical protein